MGDLSKTCSFVVSPETRKDFVQGRPEKLMVPGFYQGGLIYAVARAEEVENHVPACFIILAPGEPETYGMGAPEHFEMNCSCFGRSTDTAE